MAVLPVLMVVSITLIQTHRQAEQQVFNQLVSVANLKRSQISHWLDNNSALLGYLLSGGNTAKLRAFLAAPVQGGLEQADVNRLLKEISGAPAGAAASRPHFRTLFLYTIDGKIVAASDAAQIGRVVTRQPYFESSKTQDSVQPPYYALGNNELTMVLTRRILDERGNTVGVLGGQLDLSALSDIMLEHSGLGESGETYLVSRESNYMLTPSRFSGYASTQAYHSEGIDKGLQAQEGSGSYGDYRAPPVPVLGVYRWVPQLQATLLAEIDQDEAFAAYGKVREVGIGVATGSSLVAALLGLYIATRIARPITALTGTATRIADGALDQRVSAAPRNEIGVLALAFNSMTDQLQQVQLGLEQRVAERTAALQQAIAEQECTLVALHETISARDQLSATVRELASPVLPVLEGILVMPLVGAIDSARAAMLMGSLLSAIERHRARTVILDVTGVPLVDTHVAQVLLQAAGAARLLGAQPVLVGLRPELAQTIVGLGVDLSGLATQADLQSGVSYAMRRAAA